ncbi:hypothetical protein QL285_074822 [Trifolium repens]|nr:hypothetical protein QL285_074822 [Trifolium repens]
MGTNTEFLVDQARTHQVLPKFTMSQGLKDPKNVYQGDDFKGKFVVSSSEKTRQRFKAIVDKIRIIESFLPSNVCPPHPYSAMSARATYSKHQYPAVVQHQQP